MHRVLLLPVTLPFVASQPVPYGFGAPNLGQVVSGVERMFRGLLSPHPGDQAQESVQPQYGSQRGEEGQNIGAEGAMPAAPGPLDPLKSLASLANANANPNQLLDMAASALLKPAIHGVAQAAQNLDLPSEQLLMDALRAYESFASFAAGLPSNGSPDRLPLTSIITTLTSALPASPASPAITTFLNSLNPQVLCSQGVDLVEVNEANERRLQRLCMDLAGAFGVFATRVIPTMINLGGRAALGNML